MNQYYVVVIEGDIDPHVYGPYVTQDERDTVAVNERQRDEALENGVFALDIENGKVNIWAYGSSYLDGDKED